MSLGIVFSSSVTLNVGTPRTFYFYNASLTLPLPRIT
jgi:hypothetical protein